MSYLKQNENVARSFHNIKKIRFLSGVTSGFRLIFSTFGTNIVLSYSWLSQDMFDLMALRKWHFLISFRWEENEIELIDTWNTRVHEISVPSFHSSDACSRCVHTGSVWLFVDLISIQRTDGRPRKGNKLFETKIVLPFSPRLAFTILGTMENSHRDKLKVEDECPKKKNEIIKWDFPPNDGNSHRKNAQMPQLNLER